MSAEILIDSDELTPEILDAVAFSGNALAQFFDQNLMERNAHENMQPFAALDVKAAAAEWPFGDSSEIERSFALIQAGLSEASDDDLRWEFRRLFVGPERKAAPPWGSVYTDRDSVIFGESTLKLREFLRKQGIIVPNEENAPEDHIELMLLLMASIAQNKPHCLVEFLKDHLLTWSSHFLDVVYAETPFVFFRGTALLTKVTLEGIQDTLKVDVVYPTYSR